MKPSSAAEGSDELRPEGRAGCSNGRGMVMQVAEMFRLSVHRLVNRLVGFPEDRARLRLAERRERRIDRSPSGPNQSSCIVGYKMEIGRPC